MVMAAYVAELAQAKLAKGSDDFPANFVGDEQLHHAHVRRAERGILSWSHGRVEEAPGLDDWVGMLKVVEKLAAKS